MTDQIPRWPESLPTPSEMIEGPRQIRLGPTDLETENGVQDLIHDLYWFPDDEFFLYFPHGAGIGSELNARLDAHGVEMKKTEMYFYRHPNPAYENDFIRVLPHADVLQWQRDAAQGQMYGRVSLSLESATRKNIDFREAARVTSAAISNNEPILEAKPNFFGIGLNLNSLWRKMRKWFRQRK